MHFKTHHDLTAPDYGPLKGVPETQRHEMEKVGKEVGYMLSMAADEEVLPSNRNQGLRPSD
jgi:hypothetical protein